MDRVPPLTILAGLLLLSSAGCLSADKAQAKYTSLKQSAGIEAEPVSEVLTIWDPQLSTLNDPTRDGAMVAGLVGQVFMLSPKRNHAEARGDLAVAVYDTTPRPQGQPERTPELYHLTRETLAKLRTRDERFGLFYAMFLPWPAEWTDVTSVKVMARFQGEGGTAIQAREVAVQLVAERVKVSWEQKNFQKVGGAMLPPPPPDRRGVPDPLKLLASLRGKPAAQATPAAEKVPPPEAFARSSASAPAPDGRPAMTPVNRTPIVTTLPNTTNSSYATEGAYAGPKPGGPGPLDNVNPAAVNGPVQPIVIRRDRD